MSQHQFVQRHEPEWVEFEHWLNRSHSKEELRAFDAPAAYRRLCHQLSLAQSRHYSLEVIDRLRWLGTRGHARLYQPRTRALPRFVMFVAEEFPRLARREWRLVLLSALLFFAPLTAMIAALQWQPDLVYSVMDGAQVQQLEEMYNPQLHERLGRERETSSDLVMFGFYLKNNTTIGFQTFASGLLGGIGTLFFLIYNGLVIGAAAGHLTQLGFINTFWGFVAGHSAFELSAIVLSGAAGLMLGRALIAPGLRSRGHALRVEASHAIKLVYGAAMLFFLAALVEAFWSSLAQVAPQTKYLVGALLWSIFILYCLIAGRRRHAS